MSGLAREVRAGGVHLLTIDRPDAMNAIDMATAAALLDGLAAAASDEAARCVVIAGAGGRAFSAGFDIREMAGFDAEEMRAAFVARDPLMLRVATHPLPVVAAVDGVAYGAGALIAAACDLRVASPTARFRVTAIGYGSANATWSLPRIVGSARAKHILMTGRVVEATEGLAIGLWDAVEPRPAVETALALAAAIAAQPPGGVRDVKRLVDAAATRSVQDGWAAEHDAMLDAMRTAGRPGDAVFGRFLARDGEPPR